MTARIYDDRTEFWNWNYSKVTVNSEQWNILRRVSTTWVPIDATSGKPKFAVTSNSSYATVEKTWVPLQEPSR